MNYVLKGINFVYALCIMASPAMAQEQPCMPLTEYLAWLDQHHQERPRVQGLTETGNLIVITTSEDAGWTLLVVRPDNLACIAGFGESFQVLEPVPAGTVN